MILSSAYLAPVHYYTKLYQSALSGTPVIEEQAEHYVKQTYRNRCIIAGNDGPIALTIPVSAPTTLGAPSTSSGQALHTLGISKTPMHAVLISDHGNWRHQHWQAIVSAYRSTPYFEYYADDLQALFQIPQAPAPAPEAAGSILGVRDSEPSPQLLANFNAALRDWVLDALDLHPHIIVNRDHYLSPAPTHDFRETIRPKLPYSTDPDFRPVPYYQVFAQRHGFLPNMSIIDLLFNMGPESRIVLRNSCSS